MNLKFYKIEKSKYKGSSIILPFVMVLAMSLALVCARLFRTEFQNEMNLIDISWEILFDSYLMAKLLFTPLLITVLTSRVVDVENESNMWKVLYSAGINFKKIYFIKFIYMFKKILVFQIIEWTFIMGIVKLAGLNQPIPTFRFIVYFISQLSITFFLITLHYLFSLKWSNQLISTSVAIIGTLVGIISLLLPEGFSILNPYSWFGNLLSIRHIKVGEEFIKELNPINYSPVVISFCLGIFLLFYGSKVKGEE